MRSKVFILSALVLLLAGGLPSRAQERVRFNPDYAVHDIRLEYGYITSLSNHAPAPGFWQLTSSRITWHRVAWQKGIQFVPRANGYDQFIGLPTGLAIRSRTVPFRESMADAVDDLLYDASWSLFWGDSGFFLWDIIMAFVRRAEPYIGLTPGYYVGGRSLDSDVTPRARFSLTADAGVVMSIPIWRFSLNITPTFHYAFINNYYYDGKATRWLLSVSGGIGFMF